MTSFDHQIARIAVGAYDDAQSVRTSMMNRVRDIVRKKNEGIPFDAVEDEKAEEDRDYDAKYQDDNLPDLIDEMLEDGRLTPHEHEYLADMLEAAAMGENVEAQYQSLMAITENEPIYQEWLQHVYGVSTTLTARLLHQFGYCEDFEKVSNLWSYAGLAPGQTRTRGEQLNYSPQAKTLAWLVADRIIMTSHHADRPQYKGHFFDPYKDKQLARMGRDEDGVCLMCGQREAVAPSDEPAVCEECWLDSEGQNIPSAPNSQGHADMRARRYLAKKVLKHYWYLARQMKDLPVPDEYVVAYGDHEKREDTWENPEYALDDLQRVHET